MRHLPPSSSSISGLSSSSLNSPIALLCKLVSADDNDLEVSLSCWLLPMLFALLLYVTDFFSSVLFFLSTALLELMVELPLAFIFDSVDVSGSKT